MFKSVDCSYALAPSSNLDRKNTILIEVSDPTISMLLCRLFLQSAEMRVKTGRMERLMGTTLSTSRAKGLPISLLGGGEIVCLFGFLGFNKAELT